MGLVTFFRQPPRIDEETGCNSLNDDFEQCRQSFYLKQQNELLKNSNKKNINGQNTESQNQIETLHTEAEILKEQNIKLQLELSDYKTKYGQVLGAFTVAPDKSQKDYIISEIFSYNSLLILLLSIIVILAYYILKKKITN